MASPLKLPATQAIHAVFTTGSTSSWIDSDSIAVSVQQVTLASPTGMTLGVFQRVNSPAQYRPSFSLSSGARHSPMVQASSVSDLLPQVYNAPYIEEAPMGEHVLLYRYRMNRYFTVLNNGGTFVARRYLSTDDIAAATQVFTNNQPISATDRNNILASGVGGEFRALS